MLRSVQPHDRRRLPRPPPTAPDQRRWSDFTACTLKYVVTARPHNYNQFCAVHRTRIPRLSAQPIRLAIPLGVVAAHRLRRALEGMTTIELKRLLVGILVVPTQ